jgi:DNA-binding beta-propeller fold protein YncE
MSGALDLALGTVGPLGLQIGIAACYLSIAEWIRQQPASPGRVAMLLALPPFFAEIAFTRVFEVRALGYRRSVLVGFAGRLLVTALLGYLYVVFPILCKGTINNWFCENLRAVPRFVGMLWFSSPAAAIVLGLACAAAYVWWTVRRRKGRLSTTVIFPCVATFALFLLLYQYPSSALRGITGTRPEFVARVWTASHPDFRYPREVMVTPDETQAVATFGSTWPLDYSDLAPNNLDLDPIRCDPNGQNPAECRRNLALIDLNTGATQAWTMPITRRFYSESFVDRAFVVPWHIHYVLQLDLNGTVHKYPLPEAFGGERLQEVNVSYHASDVGRVYLVHGNNPVLLSWDERKRQPGQALSLVGWNGISLGDSVGGITRSRSRKRLYLTLHGDVSMNVEVDEVTLTPLRSFQPGVAADIEISPDEKSLYAASFLTGEIWRFDVDTLEHVQTLDAPVQCRRISFSPDGALLFAAAYLTGELVVYDTRTGLKRDSFYVAPRLEGMHVTAGGLYLLSAEGLYRIPLDELERRAALH